MFRIKTLLEIGFATALAAIALPALAQSASESFDERRSRILATYDADGDGELSGSEREVLRAALRDGHSERRGGRVPSGTDGDGRLSEAERETLREARREGGEDRRATILERYDADGDGVLSDPERQALRDARDNDGGRRRGQGGRGRGMGREGGSRDDAKRATKDRSDAARHGRSESSGRRAGGAHRRR